MKQGGANPGTVPGTNANNSIDMSLPIRLMSQQKNGNRKAGARNLAINTQGVPQQRNAWQSIDNSSV